MPSIYLFGRGRKLVKVWMGDDLLGSFVDGAKMSDTLFCRSLATMESKEPPKRITLPDRRRNRLCITSETPRALRHRLNANLCIYFLNLNAEWMCWSFADGVFRNWGAASVQHLCCHIGNRAKVQQKIILFSTLITNNNNNIHNRWKFISLSFLRSPGLSNTQTVVDVDWFRQADVTSYAENETKTAQNKTKA